MPTYDFEDTKTGKTFTEFMSMSEKDKYLKKNKHIKQCLNKINIVGGVGGMKNDQGWKENMSRIAEAHPTSPFASRFGKKSTKHIKTQQVLQKHRHRTRRKGIK
jgi:predicted nucleic acid-binding Zn ribbon protein